MRKKTYFKISLYTIKILKQFGTGSGAMGRAESREGAIL